MTRKPALCATLLASSAIAVLAACAPKDPPVEPTVEAVVEDQAVVPASVPPRMACGAEGYFQPDVTRAKLAADHGEANLAVETVPWVDSIEEALVLFPTDMTMRAELFWLGETEGGPLHARVYGDNTLWTGPDGLRMNATLEELEAANGGPFSLMGFQNHNSGEVVDWLGGALDSPDNASCRFSVSLDILDGLPEDAVAKVTGDPDKVYRSDSPEMRAVKPILIDFGVSFMRPPT